MDMNLNYSEDDSPLALKSDFILSLCELVIGGKEGLQPVDVYKRQVLDCMQENTTKIRNIKQYMKAALFNAPSTIRCV